MISENTKKLEQKYDQLGFLKQVPMHPRDRLLQKKIKNIDNNIKFIKPIPSHQQYRLARKTRGMYDKMEAVDYKPPPVDDELFSDAETVQYNIENDTRMVQRQVPSKKNSKHIAAFTIIHHTSKNECIRRKL